jgi:hypothetical protein
VGPISREPEVIRAFQVYEQHLSPIHNALDIEHPIALADDRVDDRRCQECEETVKRALDLFPEIAWPKA